MLLSQIKINIMNTYPGSLSWSNFFSRLLHRHPGRAVWVLFQTGLALVLMELDIFDHIVTALAIYANVGIAWIGAMVADLVINRRLLGIAPEHVEFRRAHLYNINPVGFGSMLVASGVSIAAYFGLVRRSARRAGTVRVTAARGGTAPGGRVGHRGPVVPGPGQRVPRGRNQPGLRGVRRRVRRHRHGHLPVPHRRDLLAVLLHRRCVQGPLQTQRVAPDQRLRHLDRHARAATEP
ncbi:MAG TPA: hypothetical protein VGM60_22250 [Pseudonocardia sp.]